MPGLSYFNFRLDYIHLKHSVFSRDRSQDILDHLQIDLIFQEPKFLNQCRLHYPENNQLFVVIFRSF